MLLIIVDINRGGPWECVVMGVKYSTSTVSPRNQFFSNYFRRLTIQNFWSDETRLPTGTLDRMVAMLEAMYSPATESKYLSYATNLLLEMTSKSPDYNKEIFEKPLSECKFQVRRRV